VNGWWNHSRANAENAQVHDWAPPPLRDDGAGFTLPGSRWNTATVGPHNEGLEPPPRRRAD
jgi:hypothetical protein